MGLMKQGRDPTAPAVGVRWTMRSPKPSGPGRRRAAAEIGGMSAAGLDLESFRTAGLRSLRSSVSIDAAFLASVDPTTLLFTSALAEEPLASVTAQFLENEYGRDDVNKFAHLAGSADKVGWLDGATRGDRIASARYREILAPLGLGDEVRVALVVGGLCWGVLCLHRSASAKGFDVTDLDFVRQVAPDLARGLRRSITLYPAQPNAPTTSPGIIILGPDLAVVSLNPAADTLLADIVDADWPAHLDLPVTIFAAAATRLDSDHRGEIASQTTTRLRRGSGGWVTVQVSPLSGGAEPQIAVILDSADTGHVSSLILAAHGLTAAQSRVVALVLQGRSTPYIVEELQISANTLQEHLHAVFDKLGIGSRRELVAALSVGPH
jgi:DNA-binding CsgD family transcriptional regulator